MNTIIYYRMLHADVKNVLHNYNSGMIIYGKQSQFHFTHKDIIIVQGYIIVSLLVLKANTFQLEHQAGIICYLLMTLLSR